MLADVLAQGHTLLMRVGVVATHQSHKLKIGGANPSPASNHDVMLPTTEETAEALESIEGTIS